MVIDNEEEIKNLKKTKNLIIGALFALVAIWFIGIIPGEWYYSFGVAVSLIGISMSIWYKQEHTYFRYTDDENSIEFKYYHVVMVSPKRKMIRIKQSLFAKYEIEQDGKIEKLYLFQRTKTGLFKYPPINISSLNNEDKKKIRINLSKHASQNN